MKRLCSTAFWLEPSYTNQASNGLTSKAPISLRPISRMPMRWTAFLARIFIKRRSLRPTLPEPTSGRHTSSRAKMGLRSICKKRCSTGLTAWGWLLEADLEGAYFDEADLTEASLRGALLKGRISVSPICILTILQHAI